MNKHLVTLITFTILLTACNKNTDNGYSKCMQYCNEDSVIVFCWSIKNMYDDDYDSTYWRFGMCRTPSNESIPSISEINTMCKNIHLTVTELGTLFKETNHTDKENISIYFTKENMNDTEYKVWVYNYPMKILDSTFSDILEEAGII